MPLEPTRLDLPTRSGLHIVADRYGDEQAPPVILLHGGGQTRHAWAGTSRALADAGFQAIAMDHRGHGESGWAPDGNYEIDGFVGDLESVIEAVVAASGQRPILVGASLGGICAMMVEGAHPNTARAIVLVDVTPRMEVSGVRRIIAFMAARPDGFASLDEVADFVAGYLPNRPRPQDVSGLAKNLRLGDDGRYRWHWDPKLMATWNPEHFDPEVGARLVRERLEVSRHIRVPVLLVRGRMSDVVSEAGAREFLDVVPHAEYVDLAAAGHMVAGDRNDAFTAAVLEFIRRTLAA